MRQNILFNSCNIKYILEFETSSFLTSTSEPTSRPPFATFILPLYCTCTYILCKHLRLVCKIRFHVLQWTKIKAYWTHTGIDRQRHRHTEEKWPTLFFLAYTTKQKVKKFWAKRLNPLSQSHIISFERSWQMHHSWKTIMRESKK